MMYFLSNGFKLKGRPWKWLMQKNKYRHKKYKEWIKSFEIN